MYVVVICILVFRTSCVPDYIAFPLKCTTSDTLNFRVNCVTCLRCVSFAVPRTLMLYVAVICISEMHCTLVFRTICVPDYIAVPLKCTTAVFHCFSLYLHTSLRARYHLTANTLSTFRTKCVTWLYWVSSEIYCSWYSCVICRTSSTQSWLV